MEFMCNICGNATSCPAEGLTREDASCPHCGSNVRTRSILRTLSFELFRVNLPLNEFPCLKSLRGLGISDIPQYSEALQSKFDYRNTFHDRAPQFDLMNPPESEFGQYDFVIASDVLEHVPPPVEAGFQNVYKLLKPSGMAILSVPYSIEPAGTIEHFPELKEFKIMDVGGRSVMVNRKGDGSIEVFENLVFHLGATPSVEMREFSEQGLRQLIAEAGFYEVSWQDQDYPPFGIVWNEPWSLPIVVRKGPPAFGADTIRELMGEIEYWRTTSRVDPPPAASRWARLGHKLGLE